MSKYFAIMMHGLPCSGKTTTARHLEKNLNLKYFSNNITRDEINKPDLFDENHKDLVYHATIRHAFNYLGSSSVVIDGTYSRLYRRKWIYKSLLIKRISLIVIYCFCDEKTARNRIEDRRKKPDIPEFQGKFTYDYVKSSFEPITTNEIIQISQIAVINFNTAKDIFHVRHNHENESYLSTVSESLHSLTKYFRYGAKCAKI